MTEDAILTASRLNRLALAGLLLLPILFYLWMGPQNHGSDDSAYGQLSWQLAQGEFTMQPHHFHKRFTVLLPTSLLFRLFGVQGYTVTLWPLLSGLGLTALVFWFTARHAGPLAGGLAALLLACNPQFTSLSVWLNGDLPLGCFLFAALVLLHLGRNAPQAKTQIWTGAGLALAFWIAFFAKETAIWILPIVAGLFFRDLLRRRARPFWIASGVVGVALLGLMLLGYGWFTGQPLYHFTANQSLYQALSIVGDLRSQPGWERLLRIPFATLLGESGLLLPLLLAAAAWFYFRPAGEEARRGALGLMTGFSFFFLAMLWFSSIALTSYMLMYFYPRFLFPVLPAASVAGGMFLAVLLSPPPPGQEARLQRWRVGFLLVGVLTMVLLWGLNYWKMWVLPLLLPVALAAAWSRWGGGRTLHRLGPPLLMALALIGLDLRHVWTMGQQWPSFVNALQVKRALVEARLGGVNDAVWILTDPRSARALTWLTGLGLKGGDPPLVGFAPWDKTPPDATGTTWLLVNRERPHPEESAPPSSLVGDWGAWRLLEMRLGIYLYQRQEGGASSTIE
ncbi:MAG: glycosyltransferase family 39 protein [Magnetococcales bacterium]|nr:glycosyltransferase family 39 protein [Magnetococcales bacterium]